MSKSYKSVKLRKDRVYSVEQLREEYSVSANTISNWVGEGLIRSDNQTPYLFRGAAVQAFHKQKRLRDRRKLRHGEFMCRGCQSCVFPKLETVKGLTAKNGKHMFQAQCPECPGKLHKISSEADRDLIEDCRNPNTPTECLHEESTLVRGDIGSISGDVVDDFHRLNDRIIHRWQIFAGGMSEKTVVRHLAAIRYFENFLGGKSFTRLSNGDFAAVRDDLKRRASVEAEDSISASSIKHTVSHIRAFCDWLLLQDGYKRLPKDFAGYLRLPKAVLAKSAQTQTKEFPTLSEAEALLAAMPYKSLVDMRARGMFALAFLGALRADTLVSLRIKHFDVERRLILQDASVVRAKAGKSLNIFWFPIPQAFEQAILDWLSTLRGLGFDGEDALFPDTKFLKYRVGCRLRNFAPVPVMTTTHSVIAAFVVACKDSGTKFTPHAAKHTIGSERDNRALTNEERKAWSLNMGHDSEVTTERHYAAMSEDKRLEVLKNLGTKTTIDPQNLSDRQKARMFDYMLEAIGS